MKQTQGMKKIRIFSSVNTEIGHIIVCSINQTRIRELLEVDQRALKDMIAKKDSISSRKTSSRKSSSSKKRPK